MPRPAMGWRASYHITADCFLQWILQNRIDRDACRVEVAVACRFSWSLCCRSCPRSAEDLRRRCRAEPMVDCSLGIRLCMWPLPTSFFSLTYQHIVYFLLG